MIDIGERIFPEFKYKWFGDELKKYIPCELNFSLEAENSDRTKEIFAKHHNIRVPYIYHEFSNDKVLVMEFVEGVSINRIKDIRDMGVDLKDVAKLLSHCFFLQIFKYGHVHADPHPGNLFISTEKGPYGKKQPVLTLLDHGLYQDLNDKIRLEYSYLWKGMLLRDEEMIKQAATDLGVGEWHALLAAMISRKPFAEIMNVNEQDYKKRLGSTHTLEEREQLQGYAKQYLKEITIVLDSINKDMLLLFKVTNFLTSITNRLGDPVNTYEIMARYCFEAVEQQELKITNDLFSRLRLWYHKARILLALRLYSIGYSFISLFRHQELPDRILL